MEVQEIRIDIKKIESYEFEEVEPDVYQRGDIQLVFDGINCVEVSILGVKFRKINSHKDLDKLIQMYEG